jgi:hypothetical protein
MGLQLKRAQLELAELTADIAGAICDLDSSWVTSEPADREAVMTEDADESMGGVPTPCVRNCCLGEDDICLGCYRSISEIMRWSEASDKEKMEILIRCRLRYKQRYDRVTRRP